MPRRRLAMLLLVLASAGWGLSFPLLKALLLAQEAATGADGAWVTVQNLLVRSAGAAAILLALAWWRTRRLPNAGEWTQSLVIALAMSLGLYLQIAALNHTSASTVGFLTQSYVIFLPLTAGILARRWPGPLLIACIVLVLAGMGLLSGLSLADLRPGRGELMVVGASLMFTIQIRALEAERWRANDGWQVTWAMFALMAAVLAPFAALTGPGLGAIPACYATPAAGLAMLLVVLVSTCLPYALMNVWQRHVSSTEAGIIYCSEAVFTAAMSLVLPTALGAWLMVGYADETLTWRMLLGGGLILAGCLLVQLRPAPPLSDR